MDTRSNDTVLAGIAVTDRNVNALPPILEADRLFVHFHGITPVPPGQTPQDKITPPLDQDQFQAVLRTFVGTDNAAPVVTHGLQTYKVPLTAPATYVRPPSHFSTADKSRLSRQELRVVEDVEKDAPTIANNMKMVYYLHHSYIKERHELAEATFQFLADICTEDVSDELLALLAKHFGLDNAGAKKLHKKLVDGRVGQKSYTEVENPLPLTHLIHQSESKFDAKIKAYVILQRNLGIKNWSKGVDVIAPPPGVSDQSIQAAAIPGVRRRATAESNRYLDQFRGRDSRGNMSTPRGRNQNGNRGNRGNRSPARASGGPPSNWNQNQRSPHQPSQQWARPPPANHQSPPSQHGEQSQQQRGRGSFRGRSRGGRGSGRGSGRGQANP